MSIFLADQLTERCLVLGNIGYLWAYADMVTRLLGVAKEEETGNAGFFAVCITISGFLSCSQPAAQEIGRLVSARSAQGTMTTKSGSRTPSPWRASGAR